MIGSSLFGFRGRRWQHPTLSMLFSVLGICLLVVCLWVIAGFLFRVGPTMEIRLEPSDLRSMGGSSYAAWVPRRAALLEYTPDTVRFPSASPTLLTENGKPIKVAHSLEEHIASGGERFVHWGDERDQVLVFSASDGSDPRQNGREYIVRLFANPPVMLVISASFILLAAALFATRGHRAAVAVGNLFVCVVAFSWLRLLAGTILIEPDSASYLRWLPLVPIGYPAFVSAWARLFGYQVIPLVQLCLLAASILFLASGAAAVTASTTVFLAVAVLVASYGQLMFYGGFLLSEALFASLILVAAGAALHMLRDFRPATACLFSLAAALSWTVRPAGIFMAAVILYQAILIRRQVPLLRTLPWLVLPALLIIGASQLANFQLRQTDVPNQIGRVVFPHFAFLLNSASVRPENLQAAQALAQAIQPHKAEFDAITNWRERHEFARRNYNARLADIDRALADFGKDFQTRDALLLSMTYDTIIHSPMRSLSWIGQHFAFGWTDSMLAISGHAPSLEANAYLERDGREQLIQQYSLPLSPDRVQIDVVRFSSTTGRFVDLLHMILSTLVNTWTVVCLALVLAMSAVIAPWSQSNTIRALGITGAIVHGTALLVSATTVFIPRYAAPTDPLLILTGILGLHGVARLAFQHRRN